MSSKIVNDEGIIQAKISPEESTIKGAIKSDESKIKGKVYYGTGSSAPVVVTSTREADDIVRASHTPREIYDLALAGSSVIYGIGTALLPLICLSDYGPKAMFGYTSRGGFVGYEILEDRTVIEHDVTFLTDQHWAELTKPAIIDVIELPTEDIQENVFYRVPDCKMFYFGDEDAEAICHVISELPDVGKPVYRYFEEEERAEYHIYCNTSTNSAWVYITEDNVDDFGADVGWHPIDVLIDWHGDPYIGIVTDIKDASGDFIALLLTSDIYMYKDGWINITPDQIGVHGSGLHSEIFNSRNNIASGGYSHAEGFYSHAEGYSSHAEGSGSHAEGFYSHAEGDSSHAEGDSSHAEGLHSHAQGWGSHAEGSYTHAEGDLSHAEGYETHAQGNYSHAEGYDTHAEGDYSHAEGNTSHAQGNYSHAEGYYTDALGYGSHAEGGHSQAIGSWSHAEGHYTEALSNYQHVQGKFNIIDSKHQYAHIVGNGTKSSERSNAHTLDWDGNAWFAGEIEGSSIALSNSDGESFSIYSGGNYYDESKGREYGIAEFWENSGDGDVILRRIAPGVRDNDAVIVSQLREALANLPSTGGSTIQIIRLEEDD